MKKGIWIAIVVTILCTGAYFAVKYIYGLNPTHVYKVDTPSSITSDKNTKTKPTSEPASAPTEQKYSNGVIGNIKISKIGVDYDIYSDYTDDLLKKGICKFYGEELNDVGNITLVGHNMRQGSLFFTKLVKLEAGDVIEIINNNGTIKYAVYDKHIVEPTDTKDVAQNDKTYRELTLVTCSDKGTKRLVVKSKEIN